MKLRVIVLACRAATREDRDTRPARLAVWLDHLEDEADVLILTEVGAIAFRRVLAGFLRQHPVWGLVQGDGVEQGETAVLVRRRPRQLNNLTGGPHKLTDKTIDRGRLFATVASKMSAGRPTTVIGTHLPARVGDRTVLGLSRNAVAWTAAAAGLRRLVKRFQARRLVVAFDSNRDHSKPAVRQAVGAFLPGLRPCWTRETLAGEIGTLENSGRFTEAVWTNGTVLSADVLSWRGMTPVSDHWPVKVVVEWEDA